MKTVLIDEPDLGSMNRQQLACTQESLQQLVRTSPGAQIEVVVSTDRVGATFVRIICEAEHVARRNGGRLTVSVPHPRVRHVFELCGLGRLVR